MTSKFRLYWPKNEKLTVKIDFIDKDGQKLTLY